MNIRQTVIGLLVLGSGIHGTACCSSNPIARLLLPATDKVLDRIENSAVDKEDTAHVFAERLTDALSIMIASTNFAYDHIRLSQSKSKAGSRLILELTALLSAAGQQWSHELATQIVDALIKKANTTTFIDYNNGATTESFTTPANRAQILAMAFIPPLAGVLGHVATRKIVRSLIQKIRETRESRYIQVA